MRMQCPYQMIVLCLSLGVALSEQATGHAAVKGNLAPAATISATSVHDHRFLPKFAVDGVVHGPQRIKLPKTTRAGKVTIRFLNSYGGMNPGAAEIMVFSASPSDDALAQITERGREAAAIGKDPTWAKHIGCNQLVVIKRHELNPTHVYTYHAEDFQPGGGLYVLSVSDCEPTLRKLVDSAAGQILDCDLSYDAREILFSWKTGSDRPYQLYRIDVDSDSDSGNDNDSDNDADADSDSDGGNPVQLTDGEAHNFNACWLPDGGIAFLSTRKPAFAYCWTSPVGVLHRMDRDGANVRRLSANYLNDFTPSVTVDGRIAYSRWEYVDRPAIPIQSLWTINPDGSGLSVFFGNRVLTPGTFMDAHSIPGTTKLLCTMTGHGGPCRGAIGIIDPAHGVNAQEAIRNLTPEVSIGRVDRGFACDERVIGPYESPYPIDGESFLVSRRGTLLLRDYEGKRQWEVLRAEGGLGFYSARPLRRRQRPPALPSLLPEEPDNWATVCLQDVYNGLGPHVKRGDVKQICVVQEIEKSRLAPLSRKAFGFQFPVVSCGATYAPKKVWGYVPVAEDGSAVFKVPAGVPIYFMAIDAQGRAVQRMRSFTHLMPGEVQGCIGCHERRLNSSSGQELPVALHREPLELTPPEWRLAGFSYAHIVQPVLDRHCTQCHHPLEPSGGVDLTGDLTDFFNVSYEVLARQGTIATNPDQGGLSKRRQLLEVGSNPYTKWIPTYNGAEDNILHVAPKTWGSPASKLAEMVLGGHPDADGKPRLKMDAAARRRVFAWIDLNVPYYGTSASNHYDLKGCRQIVPAQLDQVLSEVARRRCASCHTKGIPRKFYVRITNPHLNDFLLSPLAKSAGGSEECGKAIFQTRDDPDYQKILATFTPVAELLKKTARMDMPGSQLQTCP